MSDNQQQPNEAHFDPLVVQCLEQMISTGGSDLYFTADSPPVLRLDGKTLPSRTALSAERVAMMANSLMTPDQQQEFAEKLEMNLAVALGDRGRFRVNIFQQRGAVGMVIRLVRTKITSLDELRLPPILKTVSMSKRGLVLLVGSTGSGKSTTLAALIDYRNSNEGGHIITVEDPVEFVHQHKRCIVTQREVGFDTHSYANALKSALRQAPDVILIGEIRDVETMEAAVAFAETGHLCMSTLHANNANQAIERILNFFPPERTKEICLQLSLNMRGIISQRLVPTVDGKRAAALEILLDTPRIRDLVKRGEIEALKEAMEQSAVEGCSTFDSALFGLFQENRISAEEALKNADSPNNVRMRIERHDAAGGAEVPQEDSELRLLPILRTV